MGFIAYFFIPWVPLFAGLKTLAVIANVGYNDPSNKTTYSRGEIEIDSNEELPKELKAFACCCRHR